jgi:hypothetical protein
MKKIKYNVNEVLNNIIKNIKTDFIVCGSISDYFHFIKQDIDISVNIGDIDIITYDINFIYALEKIFNSKVKLLDLPCEELITITNKSNVSHYFLSINKTHIDIFFTSKETYDLIQTVSEKYNGQNITIVDDFDRYMQLNSTISFWYGNAPKTKRLLKYLRKKMIYYKILNDGT